MREKFSGAKRVETLRGCWNRHLPRELESVVRPVANSVELDFGLD